MLKSYSKVVDVGQSDWLLQVKRELDSDPESLRHLRIYFDETGCYEFICEGFTSQKTVGEIHHNQDGQSSQN